MNSFQRLTYLNHILTARHFRGHGIHSPYLYAYVREVVIKKGDIVQMTKERYKDREVMVTGSVYEALDSDAYISIIKDPFFSKDEKKYWEAKRPPMKMTTIHLPHHIVIFRDSRLNNQHFKIRR